MKKYLALILMVLLAKTVAAQAPEPGTFSLIPKVGVAFSRWTDYNVYETSGVSVTNKNKALFGPGLSLGVEGEYMVHPTFGASLGLMYAHEGTDHELKAAEVGLDYLNVPLTANIYVIPQFAFRVGGQMGFLLDNDIDADNLRKVDFAVHLGVQYEYRRFMLGVRYNMSLTNTLYYQSRNVSNTKNRVIQVDFGYRIPL